MFEFIFEFFATVFAETFIPSIFKYLGASVKWVFYFGTKKFKIILKEQWNKTIGFFVFLFFLLLRLALS